MPLILTLYLATRIPFLILDAIMITFVTKPLFDRQIGHLMTNLPRPGGSVLPAVSRGFCT